MGNKKKVLIVVDVQNDFVTGSLGTPEAQAIVPKIKEKFEEYKNNGDYVVYTMDTHNSDYLNTSEGKKLPVEHCIYIIETSVNYVSLIQNYFLEHMTSTLSEGKIKRYCPYLHKTSMDMMENSILMLKLFEKD